MAARARASDVLPVPGASSKRTWPSASIAVKVSRMTWALPSTAWPTLATSFSNVPANQSACSVVMVMGWSSSVVCRLVVLRRCASRVPRPWARRGQHAAYRRGIPAADFRRVSGVASTYQPACRTAVRWYHTPVGLSVDLAPAPRSGRSMPSDAGSTTCRAAALVSGCGVPVAVGTPGLARCSCGRALTWISMTWAAAGWGQHPKWHCRIRLSAVLVAVGAVAGTDPQVCACCSSLRRCGCTAGPGPRT